MGLSIKNDSSQVTPKNLALIAGLGLLLLYVVFGGKSDANPVASKTPATATANPSPTKQQRKALTTTLNNRKERDQAWQRLTVDLHNAESRDPFARLHEIKRTELAKSPEQSEAEAEAEAERLAAVERERIEQEAEQKRWEEQQLADQIAAIQSRKIDAIYETNGKAVALIGDDTIQEGDLLEGGFRVVRITTSEGLTLAVEPASHSSQTNELPEPNPIRPPPTRVRERR